MKRGAQPTLSSVTNRTYLNDLNRFIARCECSWCETEEERSFNPQAVAPPLLASYRNYLQTTLWLKPNSVNRFLNSLKRYFAWVLSTGCIEQDPAKLVKLVGEEVSAPRYLDDQKEQALLAAVTALGRLRDRAIIIMLHTGLRARELCTLTRAHVRLGKRSSTISVLMAGSVPLHRLAQLMGYDSLDTTTI